MKTVSRDKLLSALDLVSPGLAVSEKGMLEQSKHYVFKKGNIITFNDETACIYRSPIKLKGAIHATAFRSILQKLEEDSVQFETSKRVFTIKGKNKKIELALEKDIVLELKNLDVPKKWKKLPDNFGDMVAFVKDCASKDEAFYELTCIHLRPDLIEAFDNDQYACSFAKLKIKDNLLIPARALAHVSDLEVTHFSVTKAWVHFKNAAGLIFSCRRVRNRKYRNCDNLRAIKGTKIKLPQNLVKACGRAEVFAADGPDDNQVAIELSKNKVQVTGSGQYGKIDEWKKIKYKGVAMTFMIAPAMFQKLMKQQQFDSQVMPTALKVEGTKTIFITSLNTPEDLKKKRKAKEEAKKAKDGENEE